MNTTIVKKAEAEQRSLPLFKIGETSVKSICHMEQSVAPESILFKLGDAYANSICHTEESIRSECNIPTTCNSSLFVDPC